MPREALQRALQSVEPVLPDGGTDLGSDEVTPTDRSGIDGTGAPIPSDGNGELALLTPEQLCALLQVKKSWLYDQVERGALPCLRLGRHVRFRQRDVRRYLDGLSQP